MDLLDGLVEAVVDLGHLALVPDHQLLGLRLTLPHVLVPVLLDLLEKGAEGRILLLPQGLQPQLHYILISQLLLTDLLDPKFLNLLLNFPGFFILLNFNQIP